MITCYVTLPLLTLIHELGHAWAALRCGRQSLVLVGHQPLLLRHRFGRIEVRFNPILYSLRRNLNRRVSAEAVGGLCFYDHRRLSVDQLRSIARGGAMATVFAGLACATLAYLATPPGSLGFWLLAVAFATCFLNAIENLLPRTAASHATDGLRLKTLSERERHRPPAH